ncbi:MAG: hypothetical protein ACRDXC_01505 [Acidimicrobiales bacterium]
MRELSCGECLELCPDVALGIAEAEERAAVLAHVERCRACREELTSSSDVADILCVLVPAADPPDGFATRVVDAISSVSRSAPDRRDPRRLYRRPLAVVAAVVLAAAVGAGGWLATGGGAPAQATAQTVTLLSHDHRIGQVTAVGGKRPWISVAVRLRTGSTAVRCEVEDADGRWWTIGTFEVRGGRGYWAAPLTHRASIRRAELITAHGQVLATASFPRS